MSGKMLPRKSRPLGLILVHLHIYFPQAEKNDLVELAKLMEKNSCYCYSNEPEKWDDIVTKSCKEVLVAKDIWTRRFPQQSFKNEK